jgi:hypothetical protein
LSCAEEKAQGEKLRGYGDLFVGTAVEGKPVSVLAREHGVPGAPILFWAEDDQLLSAIFAREDALLLERSLHEFTSFARQGPRARRLYPRGRWPGLREVPSHIRGRATRSTKLR